MKAQSCSGDYGQSLSPSCQSSFFYAMCMNVHKGQMNSQRLISNMYKAGEKEFERQAENDSP